MFLVLTQKLNHIVIISIDNLYCDIYFGPNARPYPCNLMLTVLIQDTDIATKREIALKFLILNIGESVEDLIKDFLVRRDYCRGVKC